MIRVIRSLFRRILPPLAIAREGGKEEKEANVTVQRRVEITVEREVVSMVAPARYADAADRTAGGERHPDTPLLELPPPQPPAQLGDAGEIQYPDQRPRHSQARGKGTGGNA
jgi:hypothetical protein